MEQSDIDRLFRTAHLERVPTLKQAAEQIREVAENLKASHDGYQADVGNHDALVTRRSIIAMNKLVEAKYAVLDALGLMETDGQKGTPKPAPESE